MDYVALRRDPLWEDLWKSKEVTDKIDACRKALLTGSVVDPHALGVLRGRLNALIELHQMVDAMAEKQMKESTGKPEQSEDVKARINRLRRIFIR